MVFSMRATICSGHLRAMRVGAQVLVVVLAFACIASGQQPKKKIPPPPFELLPAEQAWLLELEAPPSAAAAMDAERVYVVLQTETVVAVNREDGTVAWTSAIESAWPPVVAGGVVFIAASDELHGLDANTGERLWRVPLELPLLAPMAFHAGSLLAVLERGDLIGVRPDDGREIWRQRVSTTRPLFAPVGGEGDAFYLTFDDGNVVALSPADGTTRWRRRLPGRLSEPAVGKDRVFVGSTNNFLYALDAEDGSIEWQWRTGGDVIGASADRTGRVYVASLDNLLRAVNRGNGNQRWRKDVTSRPAMPPRVFGYPLPAAGSEAGRLKPAPAELDLERGDDIVLLTGVGPIITSYSAKTGLVVGSYTAPAELQGAPLVDPVLTPFRVAMVVLTRDGRLIGLHPTAMLFKESAVTPLSTLPGTRLGRELLLSP